MAMLKREWVTPAAAGVMLVSAVTGTLMFFHLDTGSNKDVHEWIGLGAVALVALHVITNFRSLTTHLSGARGRAIVAAFVVVLAASFADFEGEGGGEPPFVAPMQALARQPVPVLAQVAGVTPDEMQKRLEAAAKKPVGEGATVGQLAGPDTRAQIHLLGAVMRPAGAAPARAD